MDSNARRIHELKCHVTKLNRDSRKAKSAESGDQVHDPSHEECQQPEIDALKTCALVSCQQISRYLSDYKSLLEAHSGRHKKRRPSQVLTIPLATVQQICDLGVSVPAKSTDIDPVLTQLQQKSKELATA